MRAIVVEQFGDADRLVPAVVADPVPGPGQCLIEVRASDVLYLDTMLRRGAAPPDMAPQLPWIPGNGVTGRVTSVGRGVEGDLVGRAVAAHTGNRGGYAERVAVPVADTVAIPDNVDMLTAAALLHDAPTALKLIAVTEVGDADRVLVLGASGGLGLTLVQLARMRGARVVAVARDAAKRARIAQLHPDAVIDPETDDWVSRAGEALGYEGATVILDNIGGGLVAEALALVADGGRVSTHASHGGPFPVLDADVLRRRAVTVTGIDRVQLSSAEMAQLTQQALRLAAEGRLRPVVGQTVGLTRAADAHRAIESRRVFGKTLLTVPDGESTTTGASPPAAD